MIKVITATKQSIVGRIFNSIVKELVKLSKCEV
jgi:hypothetical protein